MDDLAEWQEKYRKRTLIVFIESFRTEPKIPSVDRSTEFLKIEDLQRRAADAEDPLAAQAAQRLLEHVFVNVAFYEPASFLGQGEYERALGVALVAGRIKPDNPAVCLNVARAHAQLGQTEEALRALECLAATGAVSAALLEEDAYLEPLRGEPRFREIVGGLEGGRQEQ
jgi:tetratricopeptide (TPR) repeat protein